MKTKRNTTLDVAKGTSLLALPAIHSTLFYSLPDIQQSTYGEFLAFIAENAAPTFMLTMGIAITLGRKKTTKQIIYRSLKLLLAGYLLNFLKFILPQLWNGIPLSIFTENGLKKDLNGFFTLICVGDILQLAAISYLISALVYKLKRYHLWTLLAVLIIMWTSPLVWKIHVNDYLFDFFISFLSGRPPANFFPLFPWLTYPLAGLILGYFFKNLPKNKVFAIITLSGLTLICISLLFRKYEPIHWQSDFYRLGPSGTCFHLGLAMLFLSFCKLFIKLKLFQPQVNWLTVLSKNVTAVYMIQWLLVCWLLPLFGYHQSNMQMTIIGATLTTALTVALTFFYVHVSQRGDGKNNLSGASMQNQLTST